MIIGWTCANLSGFSKFLQPLLFTNIYTKHQFHQPGAGGGRGTPGGCRVCWTSTGFIAWGKNLWYRNLVKVLVTMYWWLVLDQIVVVIKQIKYIQIYYIIWYPVNNKFSVEEWWWFSPASQLIKEKFPMIYRVSYMLGGAGFLPATVVMMC